MLIYALKRLLGMVPTLILVLIVVFMFVHFLPGDPAALVAGPEADQETIQLIRHELGLDAPLHIQFVNYVTHLAQGNLGHSLRSNLPVRQVIGERFWPTMLLTITSMTWAIAFGLVVGVVSAVWRNKWPDRVGMSVAVSGISFPSFALGMVLIQLFAVTLGWLPSIGAASWKHYILPSLTLGAGVAAVTARFTRASFVEVIKDDFVRTARAKGLSERVVITKHVLRNALIPVVTMVGLQFGSLLGGSIVVESVFGWPGMGSLLIDSVNMRDYPVIQGLILLFAFEFLIINLAVDVLYGVINPSIRYK